jgi:hypothetical protein
MLLLITDSRTYPVLIILFPQAEPDIGILDAETSVSESLRSKHVYLVPFSHGLKGRRVHLILALVQPALCRNPCHSYAGVLHQQAFVVLALDCIS